MRKCYRWFGIGTLIMVAAAMASGQTNTFPSSGNVGIGTTSPMAPLDVTGTQTQQDPSGGDYLLNFSLGWGNGDPNPGDIILLVPASTGSPVNGSQFEGIIESNRGNGGAWNLNSEWYVSVQSAYTNNTGSILPLSGQQEYGSFPTLITCNYNGTTYIGFQTPSGNSVSEWSMTGNWSNNQNSQKPILVPPSAVTNISTLVDYESVGSQISIKSVANVGNTNMANGDVGIGTTSPTAKLEVDGGIKLTAGSGGSITFPDGTVQSTAYTGVACGGDYAEKVNVTGDRRHFEPGDVLVVDPNHPGQFLKSAAPYSTAVAGVYSTKPGFVGHAVGMPVTKNQVPMAMLGIVPTYVTAANGAIHPGDLLVTSSQIGYAMKATDRSRLTGAVIGKALGNLASGTGKIEVLVTLQ